MLIDRYFAYNRLIDFQGKTTTTERMLYYSGVTQRVGGGLDV